ncbi:MFS transporter [Sphingomonas sp. Leaf412]|uniref:MFS transporter n=1 Tax=Sphingomonas sp. Leaf412 TaxID=1736370 RepID=UPI00190FC910|nr:MFS transporter [Sphingomonas sp. Leaf412]
MATSATVADRDDTPPHGTLLAELALALGGFALGTGEFASMGLLPNVARDVHVTVPIAGHMISAYALGVVIGAPLLAAVFARAGRRAMLIGLMVFFALANMLCALAPSYGLVVAARFLAGLPHGAYFGIASLVAASLVPPDKRAQAVGRMMLGLSCANIVGVPFATSVGQAAGWRAAFVVVAGIGLATAILCRFALKPIPAPDDASPLTELGALKRGQVWLTLAIAAIGFGGVFAVYSYITPMLTQVTGITEAHVPLVLSVIGIGMVAGSLFGGWLADRGVMRAIWITLALNVVTLGLVAITAHSIAAVMINMFFVGFAALSMGPPLQTRLMDIAADAQALAASLNHSAFNTANALGAWLGGAAIASGLGWTSTGPIGALLALAGLAIWFVTWRTSAE